MLRYTLIALTLLTAAHTAVAEPEVYSTRKGAIQGYDPVAYFTAGEAVKGERAFHHRWRDADWYFASEENLNRFREDAEAFAPEFGGWCAYAMAKGRYASTDPKAWTIHEGRLYLNFSRGIRKTWSKDIPGNIERANRNWERLRSAP